MSKLALDLLRATSLLNKDNSVADLSKIPDSEIRAMLSYYHQKRSETAVQEIDRLVAARLENAATLSSISASNSVTSLCSKLLVRKTLVTSDPLYDFTAPTPEHTQVEKQALGFEPLQKVNLDTLHNKLLYFSGLSKNIEAGFHEALPLGLLHEPPEQLPVNFPKNLYREQVPPGALSFIEQTVKIRALRKEDDGFTIADNIDTSRSRQICVSFDGDDPVTGASMYFFRDVQVLGQISPTHYKIAYKPWSEQPLDQERYDRWIEQTTNQTVGARIKAVASEMHLADLLGAPYVTESSFEAKLLAHGLLPKS